jgi:cystathionine beta-lyase/cystathionine gamma-synthase
LASHLRPRIRQQKATKYLGGHGDLIAGVVAGPAEIVKQVRLKGIRYLMGAALARSPPF